MHNQATPLTLGCARPAGPVKIEMERRAVLAGELGLRTSFVESCCTLAVR